MTEDERRNDAVQKRCNHQPPKPDPVAEEFDSLNGWRLRFNQLGYGIYEDVEAEAQQRDRSSEKRDHHGASIALRKVLVRRLLHVARPDEEGDGRDQTQHILRPHRLHRLRCAHRQTDGRDDREHEKDCDPLQTLRALQLLLIVRRQLKRIARHFHRLDSACLSKFSTSARCPERNSSRRLMKAFSPGGVAITCFSVYGLVKPTYLLQGVLLVNPPMSRSSW